MAQHRPKWATCGNTLSGGEALGSTNNFPLNFIVNSQQEMAILINGNIQVASLYNGNTGIVTYSSNGTLVALNFTGNGGQVLSDNGTWVNGSSFSQWITNGSNIYFTGGNVGFGNINPQETLDVRGADANGVISTYRNGTNNNRVWVTAGMPARGDWNPLSQAGDKGIFWTDDGVANKTSGFVITPQTNSTTGIRIDATGKVSIGVFANDMPGNYRLYVKGGILTEHCRIGLDSTADWQDSVFSKKYTLPSLDFLNSYVHRYYHLPYVFSATDIKKNGIDVAQMDIILLKKIEESYLYISQQQKQLDRQQIEIDELKKEITENKKWQT